MSVEKLHAVVVVEDNDYVEGKFDNSFHEMYLDLVDVLLRQEIMVVGLRQPSSDRTLAGSEMRYPDAAEDLDKRLAVSGDWLDLGLLERYGG